ncbi:MAG: sulfur carrier protein ThiS [Pyrinomonadaceae bacterium]
MRIELNGETREIPDALTLANLVEHLELARERLAVEHNRRVVRRVEWAEINLSEGDTIEIVHFVGGGRKSK